MSPPIVDQHLHLINQAKLTRLTIPLLLSLPAPYSPSHRPRIKSPRRPSPKSIHPPASKDIPRRHPRLCRGMRRRVSRVIVAHPDSRVEIHALCLGERVIGVDEAAFGALEVVSGEGVGDGAEAKLCGRYKGLSGHDNLPRRTR